MAGIGEQGLNLGDGCKHVSFLTFGRLSQPVISKKSFHCCIPGVCEDSLVRCQRVIRIIRSATYKTKAQKCVILMAQLNSKWGVLKY